MKIDPNQDKDNLIFINNLCLILSIFSIIYFITAFTLMNTGTPIKTCKFTDGMEIPIEVKDKAEVYKVEAYYSGRINGENVSITGEVLDEHDETLYEFGKDMWFEEGRDDEGYWSDSSRDMSIELAFKEKGKYKIKLNKEGSADNAINNSIEIKIKNKVKSYVGFTQAGIGAVLLALLVFYIFNASWVNSGIGSAVEEMTDD